MKKRWISLMLVFAMVVAAVPAGLVHGEGKGFITEKVFVTYEDLEVTNEYSSSLTGLGASYVSPDSRMMVVGTDRSVIGARSLLVNKCDMRWWTLSAKDQSLFIDIAFKIDSNFNNELTMNITTQQPSTGRAASGGGDVFKVTKKDGKAVILDCGGNVIMEIEEGVRYNLRAVFQSGSSQYKLLVNSAVRSENCEFTVPVYSVEAMQILITSLGTQTTDTGAEITDPYIIIDNPALYTQGRVYPQKFSSQATGELPEVTIPKITESNDIQVYVNSTKIEMEHAPAIKDGVLYMDAEQIMRCIQMNLTEDKSKKTFEITNDNVRVKAALNSTSVTINDKEYTLKAPPIKNNGTIMVSANFLNEVLNAKVWWDEIGKMVVITTGEFKKDGILRNVGGKLYMNGEPYYEISFNKFDLYYQILSDWAPNSQYPSSQFTISAAEEALKSLSEQGFKSIRVFGYSNEFTDLMYNEEHQKIYFEAMDKMFDLCDKYGIKVVVCLGLIENYLLENNYIEGKGWITANVSTTDIVADANSESRQNVYKYLDKFITRYKDRDSVLMWEIKNEGSLEMDIGGAVNSVKYSLLQLAQFYGDCADKIRALDNKHLITSGDSILRKSQWNLFADVMKDGIITWKTDTKEERLKALALLNEKLDLLSVHAYGIGLENPEGYYLDENGKLAKYDFKFLMDEAAKIGKILYNGETNGEFDTASPTFYTDTAAFLDSIIDSGLQLTHWWTFRTDRQGFNDGMAWTIDGTELMQVIIEANNKIKAKYVVNKAAADNTNDVWDDPMFEVFDNTKVNSGLEYVVKSTTKSKMIRLAVLCGAILIVGGAAAYILTREKLKKKRKTDID